MGIRIPKIKTDGTLFDSVEQFHPSEFIYLHCGGVFDDLFVHLVPATKRLQSIQELERQSLDQHDEGSVLADALENLSVIAGDEDERIPGAARQMVRIIDPVWRLKPGVEPRIYCVDPMHLVEVVRLAAQKKLASTLFNATRRWDDFWEVRYE
jgi:hypothetical protein